MYVFVPADLLQQAARLLDVPLSPEHHSLIISVIVQAACERMEESAPRRQALFLVSRAG